MLIALLVLQGVAHATPLAMAVYESSAHDATTEGDVVIATDPDTAYATAVNYMAWSRIFGNMRTVHITESSGDEARVTFVHLDGSVDHLRFKNRPASRTVWFEQLGGRAEVSAEIQFMPGRTPGTTHVHSSLYADVHGWASAFVSDSDLREKRQEQMKHDLARLQAFFSGH